MQDFIADFVDAAALYGVTSYACLALICWVATRGGAVNSFEDPTPLGETVAMWALTYMLLAPPIFLAGVALLALIRFALDT